MHDGYYFLELCSPLGTDNVRGQISVHILLQMEATGGYCLYFILYGLLRIEIVFSQLSIHSRPQRPRSKNRDLWPVTTPEVRESRTSRQI